MLLAVCPCAAYADVATLSGFVLDNDTDQPVPCAVLVLSRSGEADQIAFPDYLGAYEFAGVAAGACQLAVHSPGYRRQSVPFYIAPGVIRVDLYASPQDAACVCLAGRVLEAATRYPLPACRIEARQAGVLLDTTYACATGDFELVLPESADSAPVEVQATLAGWQSMVTSVAPDAGESLALLMDREEKEVPCGSLVCQARAAGPHSGAGMALTWLLIVLAVRFAFSRRLPECAASGSPE